jgi:pimeloyl-ACP methyl ester carboxylesterase
MVSHAAPPDWRRWVPPEVAAAWKPFALTVGRGAAIEAVTLGQGPPVILLPPVPGWKEALWAPLAGLAARGYRATSFDLRADQGGRGWEALLDDVDAVAGRVSSGRVALLGHSLGGMLALQWAARRPERVAALVLSSTYARIHLHPSIWWTRVVVQSAVLAANRLLPERVLLALARGWARRGVWVYDPHCGDDLLRLVRAAARATPLPLVAARVRLARLFDARIHVGAVRCPTLVLSGELESRAARESAEELAAAISGARRRTIPEAGHLVPLSRPREYTSAVADWLDGLEPWEA